MQIWIRKTRCKIWLKNRVSEGLGLHLGRVWAALGRLLGALGRSWAILWPFKTDLFESIGPRWASRSLLDPFWVDFGRVWDGFGMDLHGSREDLGSQN